MPIRLRGTWGPFTRLPTGVYTGLSQATPIYDLGDGKPRHSRSLNHALGTYSVKYLRSKGIPVQLVPQQAKHRYLYFLDRGWQDRLRVPVMPYPKTVTVVDLDDAQAKFLAQALNRVMGENEPGLKVSMLRDLLEELPHG